MRTKDEFGQDSVTVEITVLKQWAFKIRTLVREHIGSGTAPEILAFNRLVSQIQSYVPDSEWKE